MCPTNSNPGLFNAIDVARDHHIRAMLLSHTTFGPSEEGYSGHTFIVWMWANGGIDIFRAMVRSGTYLGWIQDAFKVEESGRLEF